jgi:hypothetical protein
MKLAVCVMTVLFLAGPVPGDIGGCGQRADELDPYRFFISKDFIDCERCSECDLASRTCSAACDFASRDREFPEECVPLVHDGEVCLRALKAASCSDYAGYVDDRSPEVPTECNFCPAR